MTIYCPPPNCENVWRYCLSRLKSQTRTNFTLDGWKYDIIEMSHFYLNRVIFYLLKWNSSCNSNENQNKVFAEESLKMTMKHYGCFLLENWPIHVFQIFFLNSDFLGNRLKSTTRPCLWGPVDSVLLWAQNSA